MSRTIYVVAKDHEHFERWCWQQDPNGDLPNMKYVHSVKTIQYEKAGAEYIFLTGGAKRPEGEKPYWQQRADWRAIYNKAIRTQRRIR